MSARRKEAKMLPLLQHEVECAAISKEAHVQPGAVLTDERVTLSYQLLLLPASAPLLWCLAQFPNEPLPDCLRRTNLLHWQECHVQKARPYHPIAWKEQVNHNWQWRKCQNGNQLDHRMLSKQSATEVYVWESRALPHDNVLMENS
jgi:hypothetical protein